MNPYAATREAMRILIFLFAASAAATPLTDTLRSRAFDTKAMSQLMTGFQDGSPRVKARTIEFFTDLVILSDFISNYPEFRPTEHVWAEPELKAMGVEVPWKAQDLQISRDRGLLIDGLTGNLTLSTERLFRQLSRVPMQQSERIRFTRSLLGRVDHMVTRNLELKVRVGQAFERVWERSEKSHKRSRGLVFTGALSLMAGVAVMSPLLDYMFPMIATLSLEGLVLTWPLLVVRRHDNQREVHGLCRELFERAAL